MAVPFPPAAANMPGVINMYKNVEVIKHNKFIHNIGIAFIDLRTTQKKLMKQPRTVLRKICGQFNYGTLNAVMGPRKSGKTTLLKTLAGRNNEGVDEGTLLYTNEDILPRVAFLERETENNILLSLTVQEALDFAYRFRNKGAKSAERRAVLKELMGAFEMREIAELELRFCTPEERVKAQVAMVLATATRPNLIFLDEPLHDIDSVGVENLVVLLKKLCRHYAIAITFSVGQVLDSDVLTIFDKLYVLSRGGLCIYEGSVDHLSLFLREADVAISSKIQTPIERLMKVGAKPTQVTLKLANQTLSTRADILHMAEKYGVLSPNGAETPMAPLSLWNILDLFVRSATHKYRLYWHILGFYYLMIIAFTLILTTAFNDNIGQPDSCYNRTAGNSSTRGRFVIIGDRAEVDQGVLKLVGEKEIDIIHGQNLIDENAKFLFVVTAGMCLFQIVISARGLNEEVKVANNEHRNGWINISSFFIVKNIIDLVVPLVYTATCSVLAYFLTAQIMDIWRFASFLYAQVANILLAQSLGFAIGIISVFNHRYRTLMIILSSLILIVFAGYLIPMGQIEEWIQGISHLSFLKLSYELTLLSLYGLNRCRSQGYTHSYVLDEFGLNYTETYWRNWVILAVHALVYRAIFWAILVTKSTKKQTIDRPEQVEEGDMGDYEAEYKNK